MQVELQSASLMGSRALGRPTLKGSIDRGGFGAPRRYQVFGFNKGFLFYDLGKAKPDKKHDSGAMAGAVIGGVLGGMVGSMIGKELARSNSDSYDAPENSYEHKSNDELIEMARKSRHSFVVSNDEIKWLKVKKAGILAGSNCVGSVTFREASVGKICLMIDDFDSMVTAIEAFPAVLGDHATINVRLDESTYKFVSA